MRSLDLLFRTYPEKTAAEILTIMEQEKQEAEEQFKAANKAKIDWMEDINANGGYFKGRFGIDQRFYYKVTDVQFDGGLLYGTVSKVVVFLGGERSVVVEPKIEVTTKAYQKLENYGFDVYTRTNEEDWVSVNEYIIGIKKFWNNLD